MRIKPTKGGGIILAKKKTPPRKRSIAHSDVPLKDRLLVNKLTSIAQHRDHAALIALKLATVALNDTEGLGYTRLCRFARRQRESLPTNIIPTRITWKLS